MLHFMWGAIAAVNVIAGLFFLRFWRQTRERLFALLGAAFCVFALNYLCLIVVQPGPESRHWVYLLRLAAFLLILGGVIDKNLRPRS
ncbi:MAG: DUF5985 family protein [Polyangiales bacterium]